MRKSEIVYRRGKHFIRSLRIDNLRSREGVHVKAAYGKAFQKRHESYAGYFSYWNRIPYV